MIDYSVPAGQVRLLIPDTDETNLLLDTEQIEAFLVMEGGSVKLAAAQAIDTIANSEALVSKKITKEGLSTDGTAVATSLRTRAQSLRDQVAEGVGDDDVGFDIVDFDPHAAYRHYSNW